MLQPAFGARVRTPCRHCQRKPQGVVEGAAINLDLRVEASGDRPLGHGDVEIGGAGVEQRDHPGGDGELERNVERVAEADLEARPEAERERVGGRRDGADAAREVRADERRDGRDGGPQIARRSGSPTTSLTLRLTQIRASAGRSWRSASPITLPLSATRYESAPWRTIATPRSGTTTTRSVCGKARSKRALSTVGIASTACSDSVEVDLEQARAAGRRRGPCEPVPRRPGSPRPRRPCGRRTRPSRARRARRPSAPSAIRNAIPSERPEGTSRERSRRSPETRRGSGAAASAARARGRDPRSTRPPVATRFLSPPATCETLARPATPPPTSPSSSTSCSSSTPNCSRARRRASAIRARQSAVVAPPAFSMKFACFGEISAPPIRCPLRPHASSIAPAPSSPAGFLNTEPNVRFVVGWVALRRSTRSRTVARISVSSRGSSWYSTAATTWPWSDARVPVREAELGGREPARSVGGRDERADHDRAPVASVGAGVHPHSPTRGARDRAGELEASECCGAGSVQADRVRRAAARHERRSLGPRLDELAGEMQHEHVDAVVGGEQVRAEPDGRDLRARAPARPRGRLRAPATDRGSA